MSNAVTVELGAPPNVFQRRREQLAAAIDRPMVIFAGHAPARTVATMTHAFLPGSHFRYFGGAAIEDAALLIEPGENGTDGCTLFRPVAGPDDALWLGALPDDQAIATASGLSSSAIKNADQLATSLAGRKASAVAPPFPRTIATVARLALDEPSDDEKLAIIDQRIIKDEHEIRAMCDAAQVAAGAHRAAIMATKIGRTEWDAESALLAAFAAAGVGPSFTPIVTVKGEVLHGASAGRRFEDGALLLIDAGAQGPTGYASDVTRTVPVSGRWSPVQRILYDTVLRAQRAAIDSCRPGRRFLDVHLLAARIIIEGLIDAGLLTGNVNELVQRGAHAPFFPHGVGHLIGLDAHDLEDFGDLAGYASGRTRPTRFGDNALRLDRDLVPGMTVTIEPGIYFVPSIWKRNDLVQPLADCVNRSAVDELLEEGFGGIRIEENVLVRDANADGPDVLTSALPNDPDQIASLVGSAN